MKEIILGILLLTLVGCAEDSVTDGTVTIAGSADLNLNENITECMVRQNGTSYFVQQTGFDPYTFVFDASVLYEDEFISMTIADVLRVSPLTQTEQDIIDGIL